jgi:hypothetical protein
LKLGRAVAGDFFDRKSDAREIRDGASGVADDCSGLAIGEGIFR